MPKRAGVIPFYRHKDGKIRMLFMKPGDPKYGGNRFQIAKGMIDEGENERQAALREGSEELGLKESNIAKLELVGYDKGFKMSLFVALVKDPKNFGSFHFETAATKWMEWGDYFTQARREQIKVTGFALRKMKEMV